MRGLLVAAPGRLELAELPEPEPVAGEVLVRVTAAGICGTDLHVLAGHHGGLPVVLGHELSGVVAAVGDGVAHLAPGDAVVVDPNLPCGACATCWAGRPNLCTDLHALGIDRAGGAADFVVAPATCCVPVPQLDDPAVMALAEPLSCALHAMDVLGPVVGTDALVYGAGTMGLLLGWLLRRAGAAVDVVEPDPRRRTLAEALGAGRTADDARELGEGWDVVVDASGSPAAIRDGLGRVRPAGTFLQVGVTAPDAVVELRPYDLYRRELRLVGSMAVAHSIERAARLLAGAVTELGRLVTHRVPLTQGVDAVEAFRAGSGVKTLLLPEG